jgi:hypothetical protein
MQLKFIDCIGPRCENDELIRALWKCYQYMSDVLPGPCADRKCIHSSCQAVRSVNTALRRRK